MYISTLLYHTLKGDDKMLVSLLSFDKKSYLFDTTHLIFISAIALKYDDGNMIFFVEQCNILIKSDLGAGSFHYNIAVSFLYDTLGSFFKWRYVEC